MSVVVSGRVDVFDAAGKYQLYANTVQQEGIGELYQKFEQLKQYYEDMGYFAKEYKRPLPAFTRELGVVTSKTGAAVQDIMNISKGVTLISRLYFILHMFRENMQTVNCKRNYQT